jgi:hypothetical protein
MTPILPFITITTKFLSKHCIKRLSLFQFYRKKTFLQSVDPKQPSNFHFDLSLKLSQGEVHDFSGEVQKLSGEVQNDLRGGAHLPTPPLKIPPWLGSYPGTISASIFFCLSLVSYKCVVMYSTV